ncbi:hypothetical protein [Mangrovicoccus sp. HB161399]|uniref:hypothetical protein n=1 Tax=Mangrovicoccus sp. HB161399 TaxID=2720392 RepID=UPI001551B9D5|nr:hypothetical protein [Mangrovicoccus sp. HB161399]
MVGLVFETANQGRTADPNRMDVAAIIGLAGLRAPAGLPLPDGPALHENDGTGTARLDGLGRPVPSADAVLNRLRQRLEAEGWGPRLEATGGQIADIPVRLRSFDEFAAIFAVAARPDRQAVVRGRPLPDPVTVTAATALAVVNVDGTDREIALPPGGMAREDLRAALQAGLGSAADVALEPVSGTGYAALAFRRRATGQPGSLTVYANDALGFAVAGHDAAGTAASPLELAVAGFFEGGGREAVVIRTGDPAPLVCSAAERLAALRLVLGIGADALPGAATLADWQGAALPALASSAMAQADWRGCAVLNALPDVTHVLFPDLPELLQELEPAAPQPVLPDRPPEVFAVCAADPAPGQAGAAEALAPARSGLAGLQVWSALAQWLDVQLRRISPELICLLALPLPDRSAAARLPELLSSMAQGSGGFARLSSDRVQVVYPWVVSPLARGYPGTAMPADGLLAGIIAGSTLAQGAWRTVAGRALPRVLSILPDARPAPDPDAGALAQLTLLGRRARGWQVLSDRSFTLETGPVQAGVRRLMALVLRAARRQGEPMVFRGNGDRLAAEIAYGLGTLLRRIWREGALRGATEAEAFSVVCDGSTMSAADRDAGRLVAQVTLAPAQSVETMIISLAARDDGALVPEGAAP